MLGSSSVISLLLYFQRETVVSERNVAMSVSVPVCKLMSSRRINPLTYTFSPKLTIKLRNFVLLLSMGLANLNFITITLTVLEVLKSQVRPKLNQLITGMSRISRQSSGM